MPTRDQILKALEAVIDPELRDNIVALDMVRSIDIREDGQVDVTVSLTTPGCPIRSHFQTARRNAVQALPGVTRVNVAFDVLNDQQKQALQRKLGRGGLPDGALALVQNVICVGSGKGGVGKSTLTVNLAAALPPRARSVGILDADVWGYSIPRMLGLGNDRPPVSPRAQDHPARGARHQGHVDRLLRAGELGRRLARADAPQGAHPVPRGRRRGASWTTCSSTCRRAPATSR